MNISPIKLYDAVFKGEVSVGSLSRYVITKVSYLKLLMCMCMYDREYCIWIPVVYGIICVYPLLVDFMNICPLILH